jgi:hypothetical protein
VIIENYEQLHGIEVHNIFHEMMMMLMNKYGYLQYEYLLHKVLYFYFGDHMLVILVVLVVVINMLLALVFVSEIWQQGS